MPESFNTVDEGSSALLLFLIDVTRHLRETTKEGRKKGGMKERRKVGRKGGREGMKDEGRRGLC